MAAKQASSSLHLIALREGFKLPNSARQDPHSLLQPTFLVFFVFFLHFSQLDLCSSQVGISSGPWLCLQTFRSCASDDAFDPP